MKIQKVKINNFQGLAGFHEIDFNKITALSQPNGSGKTSLINAIRFGLTGVEPSGEMITKGSSSTAVRIFLENGANFFRQKFAQKGKSSKYYVGDSATTLSRLNDYITHELGGVPINTAKIISSGELLTSMTSQNFGELLLQYLPESMTVKTVIERFPNANKEQISIIEKCLPDKEFEISEINAFYKLLVERRRMIKEKLGQFEAVLNNIAENKPKFTLEELSQKIIEVNLERDNLIKLQSNTDLYNNIAREIAFRDAKLKEIDAELSTMVGKEHSQEELNMMDQLISNTKKHRDNTMLALQSMVESKKQLNLAIENISKPICPLSDKIVCTVDRTPALNSIKIDISKIEEDYKVQRQIYAETLSQLQKYEADKDLMIKETNTYLRIQDRLKQKEELLSKELILPDKPNDVGPSLKMIDEELSNLQKDYVAVQNYSKKDKIEQSINKLTIQLSDYEGLVQAFSPKGAVKEAITSYYMDEFSEPCNQKAKELFNGMNLKFVTEKGVKVLTDVNGSGEYLEFNSLSGGEKASVMFLLVSMLSSLSGMGIIILDELSVLDDEVFNNLIKVLVENQNEYDMCLIASVNHVDTLKTLKEYNIPIVTVNAKENNEKVIPLENTQFDKSKEESNDDDETANYDIEKNKVNTRQSSVSDKENTISDLKSLVATTAEEAKDLRFVPKEDDFELVDENGKVVTSENEDLSDTTEDTISKSENLSVTKDVVLESEEKGNEIAEYKPKNEITEDRYESLIKGYEFRGKTKEVLKFMIKDSENNIFNGFAKEIANSLDISQPTIGKIIKALESLELIKNLKRGVWELSSELFE